METEQGNKLIADFMGYEWPRVGFYYTELEIEQIRAYEIGKLKYHSSWDWLMPVVEKLETTGYRVSIFRKCCDIVDDQLEYDNLIEITAMPTKIEAVWIAVVQLIQEYSLNKIH